jgi:membrane protease YdiL (CAAX protease family)
MVPAAAVAGPASPWAGLVPSPAVPAPGTAPSVSPPLPQRAVVLTVVAIAIGALAMGVSYLLGQDQNIAPATYLRYAIVLTLAVYAIVGILVVTQVTPTVRLRWSDGQPAMGVAIGLLVGGGLSLVLLLLVSAATGHLDPDPRIVLLMSEGDASHVFAAVLISCVAAPLVEEVLFRGLLLESQRTRGTAAAIWLSAAGFAVWHLNPAALRYYALLGALLGWLYTRRGLACSMAAHLGFNGVLTVAALSVVLSPGASLDVGGLTAHLPSGWRAASASDLPESLTAAGSVVGFRGPSGAALVAVAVPSPSTPTVDEIYDRFTSSGFSTLLPGHTDLRELRLPVGPAVEVVAKIHGDDVTVVFVPHAGRSYELVMRGAGSVKARADFARILRDLRIS